MSKCCVCVEVEFVDVSLRFANPCLLLVDVRTIAQASIHVHTHTHTTKVRANYFIRAKRQRERQGEREREVPKTM